MDLNELVRDTVRDEMKTVIRAEVKSILAEALAGFDREPAPEPAALAPGPAPAGQVTAAKIKKPFTGKLTPTAITGIRVGLGVNKTQFAFIVHAHPTSVVMWEKGKTRPGSVMAKRIREVSGFTEKEAATILAGRKAATH